MSPSALIIFMKNPVLGKVKTRLAHSVGDKAALAIYQRLLTYTQRVVSHLAVDIFVYYADEIVADDQWNFAHKCQQIPGDLGMKMMAAIRDQLADYHKVCIIGTDCATLLASHLVCAFQQLDSHDVVFGPANDGGYYLLGIKEMHTALFERMPWSTARVLPQSIAALQHLGKSHYLLPILIDVDTIEDWYLVKARCEPKRHTFSFAQLKKHPPNR